MPFETLLPLVLTALAFMGTVVTLVVVAKSRTAALTESRLREEVERLRATLSAENREVARAVDAGIRTLSLELMGRVSKDIGANREQQLHTAQELQRRVQDSMEKIRAENAQQLDKIRGESSSQLDKMRATVEEKLQSTLEARLGESFRTVSDRLEQVYKGLGEMQTLATGVGDLKRVLTNVRTRGSFGEAQLAALLEQVLVPNQYDKDVATIPGSVERVEFAIRLPGDGEGSHVYLPIDAKFPVEDYERLTAAYAAGDLQGIEDSAKALRKRVLEEANKIRRKYVSPPHTTDIALLYLPNEGLYAEVLRYPGMQDEMQRLKIVPCGPSTLFAVLNSLHLGFRTLALQKRSHEVWQVLGAVKTEFTKFGDTLNKVKEKLDQASQKISETEVRSRAMQKALRSVEAMPEVEAVKILPELMGGEPNIV